MIIIYFFLIHFRCQCDHCRECSLSENALNTVLITSFDVAPFLPLFHYNKGMLCMNLYKINKVISIEKMILLENAICLGQDVSRINKL